MANWRGQDLNQELRLVLSESEIQAVLWAIGEHKVSSIPEKHFKNIVSVRKELRLTLKQKDEVYV